jgi:hypothetical protein
MKIRFLTVLITLAFLGFSISAFAGKSDNPGGGGKVYPTFDVDFGGLIGGSGTKWQSGQKQEGITYWLSDQKSGTGVIALIHFQDDEGPFGNFGKTCFPQNFTPINGVQFWRDKDGSAILKMSFLGKSANDSMSFMYLLTLNGDFDFPENWLPETPNLTTVTIDSWKLKLKKKHENNLYSDISCVGEDTFTASIVVSRN